MYTVIKRRSVVCLCWEQSWTPTFGPVQTVQWRTTLSMCSEPRRMVQYRLYSGVRLWVCALNPDVWSSTDCTVAYDSEYVLWRMVQYSGVRLWVRALTYGPVQWRRTLSTCSDVWSSTVAYDSEYELWKFTSYDAATATPARAAKYPDKYVTCSINCE